MSLKTTITHPSFKNRVVGFLFESYANSIDSDLRYKDLGFQDVFPDSEDSQFDTEWGPAKGILTVEGQKYGDNTKYRDYPKAVTYKKFTSTLSWTEEHLHWLGKGSQQKQVMQIRDTVTAAVNALHANINDEAAKMLYLGFGTTNYTNGDALALFSGSHTIRAGGTHSNIFPSGDTHRPVSPSALTDGVVLMQKFVGQNGRKLRKASRIRIACSTSNLPVVQKVVDSIQGPDVANLGLQTASKQAFARRGVVIDYVDVPDMPDAYDDYWFLIALDRCVDRAFCAWMWKPRMANDNTLNSGTFENDASTALGFVLVGWQMFFGSKGDSSAI